MAPPSDTAPPPESPVPEDIVIEELARLAFVIPADPDKLSFVRLSIVFTVAEIVLLVKVSVVVLPTYVSFP